MEKSPTNRALFRSIMIAYTGFSQTVSNIFSIDAGEIYEPPAINNNHSMERPNRLSQKGRRKRANWIR